MIRRTEIPRRFADYGPYPPPGQRRDFDHHAWMMSEDLHTGVVPLGSGRRGTRFHLDGPDDQVSAGRFVLETLAYRVGARGSDPLAAAVETVAAMIAQDGRASFELVRDPENGRIGLMHIPAPSLFRLPFAWIQVLRVNVSPDQTKTMFRAATARHVWSTTLPHHLGGRDSLRRALDVLGRPPSTLPLFVMAAPLNPVRDGFDLRKYERDSATLQIRVTRPWGWNRRDTSTRLTTEFYWLYKLATLHWARRLLLEHIITNINTLLARIDIQASLSVTGCASAEMLLQAREQFRRGEIGPGELLRLSR